MRFLLVSLLLISKLASSSELFQLGPELNYALDETKTQALQQWINFSRSQHQVYDKSVYRDLVKPHLEAISKAKVLLGQALPDPAAFATFWMAGDLKSLQSKLLAIYHFTETVRFPARASQKLDTLQENLLKFEYHSESYTESQNRLFEFREELEDLELISEFNEIWKQGGISEAKLKNTRNLYDLLYQFQIYVQSTKYKSLDFRVAGFWVVYSHFKPRLAVVYRGSEVEANLWLYRSRLEDFVGSGLMIEKVELQKLH